MVSRILGPDGQPIALATLQEPQTSKVGQLHREFASHPSRGLNPTRLSAILLAAEHGDITAQYELFEDMEERDAHIYAEMSKRRRAVVGLPWDIVPPSNPSARERENAKLLHELVQEVPDLEESLFDLTDAIGKGFSNLEIDWHRINGVWLPKSLSYRPQSWFRLYRGFRQEIRLRDASADGDPLRPLGWVTHTHKAKSGYVERSGLFRALVWPYLFKIYAVGDLAEFLEIYGIPMRVGKYPPSANEKEKVTLLRAITSVGHDSAGIIPEGMLIDFHDAAQGDPKAFELMMDWCERSESKVILGATLTSQADRGSNTNALGNVHNDVRKDLRDSDAKQIASTLTRDLVFAIAALNGLAPDGMRRCPRFAFDVSEMEDLTTYAEALPKLVQIGMRIPRNWAQEQLGIPEPEGAEDVLGAAVSPPPEPGAARAMLKATAANLFVPADLSALDRLLDQIESGSELQAQAKQTLAALIDLADQSPTQLAEQLAALYPALDDSGLQDALDRLLFVAQVQGATHARQR